MIKETLREEPPRLLTTLIKYVLPRALRGNYLSQLSEYYKSLRQFLPESVMAVIEGYRMQIVAAFRKVTFATQLFVVVFCFGASGIPMGIGIAIGAILGALVLRDGYTHPWEGVSQKIVKGPAAPRHFLDRAADAAIAGVFLMAAQALILRISPWLAIPPTRFNHAMILCLPTLMTLRMLMYPKPAGKVPFEGSSMSPESMYWMTWRLNILWLAAACFTILTNPIAIPAFIPEHAFIHGALPLATFAVWRRLQRDAIGRGVTIETVFRHHKDLRRKYMEANLLKGVAAKDSIYPLYIVLEILFFLQVLAPLAMGIWPWLSGHEPSLDVFRTFFNLSAFATLALSWDQVKATNHAAAEAFRQFGESGRSQP
jgi:hypothetical protein